MYIDNKLIVGDIEAVDEATTALNKNGLVLKIVEGLEDYLSCEVRFSEDKKQVWLGYPCLIKNLEKSFVIKLKRCGHKTPHMQKILIVRPMIASDKMLKWTKKSAHSELDLFLMKHS